MSPPRFSTFHDFMTEFVTPRRAITEGQRLDGQSAGPTAFRPIARFDYLGRTWGVDGDTHFEPLELAHRALLDGPEMEPFTIGQTGTRMKLVLRAELDLRRRDRGLRNAAYLYVYAS